ncbi:replication factor C small subunit [Candidatus Micrarchaeota archaeon]|nr:replication factor C small subunit [Candidatus Micrarchaeota archaeon]MBU1165562.1 replication factor C small subunit [Candidatus Micrarchaeota archaeon]MBU1887372.1 replication factor C small subunit [Candidatus Micrarchaeota archaeon]
MNSTHNKIDDILPWTEKYRPKKLDEVAGQNDIITSLKAFVKSRNMPNMLFAGPPGVGKTTSCLALARELYSDNIRGNFLDLNASDERGIDVVRGRIKDFARSIALGDVPFKLIFLDEGDALTNDAQQALRRTMESNSSVTRFVISANYSSKIIEPIQSRCAVFRFIPLTEHEMKKTLEHVVKEEKLKADENIYETIFYVSEGDMRKAMNVLQGCAMHSKHITSELVHKISSRATPKEVKEMIDFALQGKFQEARTKLDRLIITYGLSGDDVLMQTYKEVGKMEIPEKQRIKLMELVGEYNFRLVQGANERIQLEALLAQFACTKE